MLGRGRTAEPGEGLSGGRWRRQHGAVGGLPWNERGGGEGSE